MKARINLKPCPFCGGKVTAVPGLMAGITMIHCRKCGATVSFQQKEELDQTFEAWDRRAEG